MTICVKCCDEAVDAAVYRAFEAAARCGHCGGSWLEILLYGSGPDMPRREEVRCPHCGELAVIPANQARDSCTADECGVRGTRGEQP